MKHSNWHEYQRRDRKIHRVTLSDMALIIGLHATLFIVTRALQKGFQLMSEVDALIPNKNSSKIIFDKKMANKARKGILLITKFYKSTNNAAVLYPQKRKLGGNADVHT